MPLPNVDGTRIALWLAAALLAVSMPGVAAEAPAHHLWRVEGGSARVYLLGSLHMLRAEDYPLPAAMGAAFADARTVVFETDFAMLESAAGRAQLMTRAVLPEGEALSQHVSPDVRARLNAYFERSGVPPGLLERLKPAMAAVTIEVLELARFGLDPAWGVDKHLYARARAEGKRMLFLESLEFQLSLILDLSRADGEALLSTTLKKVEQGEKSLAQLLAAWKSGDTRALEALVIAPMRGFPSLHARMITDRNERWLEPIEALLQGSENALVVVGAAHLVGEKGVVELLRRRGYRVTQL